MSAAVAPVILGLEIVLLVASLYGGWRVQQRPIEMLVLGLEAVLFTAGLVLQCRVLFTPRSAPPVRLPPWEVPVFEVLLFIFCVLWGGFFAGLPVAALEKFRPLEGVAKIIVYNTATQFGLLGGALVFRQFFASPGLPRTERRPNFLLAGAATFLISLPLLGATAAVWSTFLRAIEIPHLPQELVEMLRQNRALTSFAALTVLAVVVAPVTEEVIFRGVIFRWLRTRLSRPAALVLPGLVFAALHVSWSTTLAGLDSFLPLIVLAVLYSLAYERTGHLGAPIVAHALFNLHTVLLLLTGIQV